jgi:hypothetical protein
VRGDSRPEYYDFDLFAASDSARALADRRLTDLVYTVFDTETTGLEPSGGDEIIQIGAARIVAGKLRREDSFEQLVNPQRDIPAAGIPIHGIRPEMVAGQPTIDRVLPAFHAFAQDTVLVAHNAAFDMRFLQLKEERTGMRVRPAGARHAAAVGGGASAPGIARAGSHRRAAGRHGAGPPHRAGRRAGHGGGVPEAVPLLAERASTRWGRRGRPRRRRTTRG